MSQRISIPSSCSVHQPCSIGRNARFLAIFIVLAFYCAMAAAATRVVTNLNDSGAGSLRQTIATSVEGDAIVIEVAGTITLTGGELVVGRGVTIIGPGSAHLTISGNDRSRIFNFFSGTTSSISGLTISQGRVAGRNGTNLSAGCTSFGWLEITNASAGLPGTGGAILNGGTLTVADCSFFANSAVGGAGGHGSAVHLSCGTALSDGMSGGDAFGGAIYNSGNLLVDGCLFLNNSVSGGMGGLGGDDWQAGVERRGGHGGSAAGPGIYNSGALIATHCTFADNFATGGNGGNGGTRFVEGFGGRGGRGGASTGGGIAHSGSSVEALNRGSVEPWKR